MSIYIGREGLIRFYDSTATPYYVEFILENMDFKGPMGRPRPEETLVLNRENIDSNIHYIVTSERAIAEPVAVSFTARLDDTTLKQRLRDMIDADSGAAWTVDGDTWVTTKGDGSLVDVDGNSTTAPAFADTRKRCVNVEVLWNSGANDIGLKYIAVYFDPAQQEIAEAEDAVTVTLNGMCYEAISEITAFTAGTAS
jgi:hypothetical protein